jgi:ArsR family transcriptional regulator
LTGRVANSICFDSYASIEPTLIEHPVASPKPSKLSDREIEHIAAALAAPRRVQILKEIGSTEEAYPCTALIESHGISAATVSHHIKELERANLIAIMRDGKFLKLKLNRDVLRAYAEHLAAI